MVAAAAGISQRQIEPQGQVGLQTAGGDLLELIDQWQRQAAAKTLIGRRGAAEAVAQHPVPGSQSRLNHLLHMLGAIGGIEQQLGGGFGGGAPRRMQQQLAQGLAEGRAPRLARELHLGPGGQQTRTRQPGGQGLQLGRFAAAIDAFEHHKAAARWSSFSGHGSGPHCGRHPAATGR